MFLCPAADDEAKYPLALVAKMRRKVRGKIRTYFFRFHDHPFLVDEDFKYLAASANTRSIEGATVAVGMACLAIAARVAFSGLPFAVEVVVEMFMALVHLLCECFCGHQDDDDAERVQDELQYP